MDKINTIIGKVFKMAMDEISDELTFEDIERWDSFTHMDLIVSLESEFNIHFDMDEIISMKDIKSIKEIISNKG